MMRFSVITTIVLFFVTIVNAAEISFSGNVKKVIKVKPEASTGLEMIYVVSSLDGVELSYNSNGSNVEWFNYNESGGGNAIALSGISYNGAVSTCANPKGNIGYIIKEDNRQYCFWIVDYSKYALQLNSISFPEEQDCGSATLNIDAVCDPITYYTINGVPKKLDREVKISYNTLEWDAENKVYNQVEYSKNYDSLGVTVVLSAPLMNTSFTITGDKFLKEWGIEQTLISDTYITKAVEVQGLALQSERENSNEQKDESSVLGGSAPAEINFQSYCTDAVVYKEWVFSKDPEFSNITLRFNEDDITYSFRENGTFYVKFVGGNDDGSCQSESEVFQISIGESKLECPNAFSPNATEGINDEWKVSYKSIVSFSCWIFDRYGTQLFKFDDPSKGWDGKYKGKYVKSGVYYYIIEAVGADGKEYKLKGDINILKSSKR